MGTEIGFLYREGDKMSALAEEYFRVDGHGELSCCDGGKKEGLKEKLEAIRAQHEGDNETIHREWFSTWQP